MWSWKKSESGPLRSEDVDQQSQSGSISPFRRMLKRFGIAGFLFFFLKGVILWILVPLGLFRWFGGCE